VEKPPSQYEIDIKNAIDQIYYKNPSYGVRRIKKVSWTKIQNNRLTLGKTIYAKNGHSHLLSRTETKQACKTS